MNIENPNLYVEINKSNYICIVGKYDINQNFNIIEKIIIPCREIKNKKFININDASKKIKEHVEIIEKKLNFIFKEVTVIIEDFDFTCTNISGFKKLNGSQIQKENISYILNSLKTTISESEKEKTILHIFNSSSILDGTRVENLPIGLFGNFYNHVLTFFLIQNNDLKNIKLIFNKSNLEIKKVILKSFCEGVQLIKQKSFSENFVLIKIGKETSKIIIFDQKSFKYLEHFDFGTDIILKDVTKICSLDHKTIINILSENYFRNKSFNTDEVIEEKFFKQDSYRKIRKNLILDIVNARIEEILNIIFNKNINIDAFKFNNFDSYLIIEDDIISGNFEENFNHYLSVSEKSKINLSEDFQVDTLIASASNLSIYGWSKEAIPIMQTKNSLITRIFKSIFG